MLCENCGKKEAVVFFKQIVNDKTTELHLCEDCAESRGISPFGFAGDLEGCGFKLADLLAGLAETPEAPGAEKTVDLRCPNCRMKYSDFRKIGRLGCSECYAAFRKNLEPLLKKIHGAHCHVGRCPPATAAEGTKEEADLETLRGQLRQAIREEDFERAAQLRDQIRARERPRPGEGK